MKDGFKDSIDDHRSEYNWNLSNYKLLALKDSVCYKFKKKMILFVLHNFMFLLILETFYVPNIAY